MKNESALKHRELTQKIIGVFFEVYNELGHGFLESVYQKAFDLALISKGLRVCRKVEVPVWFLMLKSAYYSTSESSQSSKDWLLIILGSSEQKKRAFWTRCLHPTNWDRSNGSVAQLPLLSDPRSSAANFDL
jgi:hypothetical protein